MRDNEGADASRDDRLPLAGRARRQEIARRRGEKIAARMARPFPLWKFVVCWSTVAVATALLLASIYIGINAIPDDIYDRHVFAWYFPVDLLGLLVPFVAALAIYPSLRATWSLGYSRFFRYGLAAVAPLPILAIYAIPSRSPIPLAYLAGLIPLGLVLWRYRTHRIDADNANLAETAHGAATARLGPEPRSKARNALKSVGLIVAEIVAIDVLFVLFLVPGASYGPLLGEYPSDPSWNRGETRIAFTEDLSGLRFQSKTADPAGSDRNELGIRTDSFGPRWSPTDELLGTWVTDNSDSATSWWQTFRVGSDGQSQRTSHDAQGEWHARGPWWSPDGNRFAWVGWLTDEAPPQIVLTGIDGSDPRWIPVSTRRSRLLGMTWSPDGSTIAYVLTKPAGAGVWVMDVSSGAAVEITTTRSAQAPRWSPDGRFIAFVSGNSLARIDPDGTNAATIAPAIVAPDTSTDDTVPRFLWSPDGAWLAYSTFSDGLRGLSLVRYDGSESHEIARFPNARFGLELGDWSDDGSTILLSEHRRGYGLIVTVDTRTGVVRELIRGSRSIPACRSSSGAFRWLPC